MIRYETELTCHAGLPERHCKRMLFSLTLYPCRYARHLHLPHPFSVLPSAYLTACFPLQGQYRLNAFRFVEYCWVRYLLSTVGSVIHDRNLIISCSWPIAFWLKPISHFGLLCITIFITSSHVFTIPAISVTPSLWLPGSVFLTIHAPHIAYVSFVRVALYSYS